MTDKKEHIHQIVEDWKKRVTEGLTEDEAKFILADESERKKHPEWAERIHKANSDKGKGAER